MFDDFDRGPRNGVVKYVISGDYTLLRLSTGFIHISSEKWKQVIAGVKSLIRKIGGVLLQLRSFSNTLYSSESLIGTEEAPRKPSKKRPKI